MRGERHWATFFEFFDHIRHRVGGAYWSARIQDPEVVAELAAQKEPDSPQPPPIEGFGHLEATLANLVDRVTQVVYASMRADPSVAPLTPRPDYPHVAARGQLRRASLDEMSMQLTGGE
ncbi:hypothetical protein [Nocardia sp. NPDC050793]|uniref:hypothetical protein n=1 Tax=Nocardia sp. NPDC050793 TaxID=3155159 RepID=UPI0033F86EF5